MINFLNKTALVTGGLGNLGLEICKSFLENGIKNLIVIDINDKNIDKLQKLTNSQLGQEVFFVKTDLTDLARSRIALTDLLASMTSLDILVNNAAFVGNSSLKNWNVDYLDQSLDSWNQALQMNLTVPNEIIKICLNSFFSFIVNLCFPKLSTYLLMYLIFCVLSNLFQDFFLSKVFSFSNNFSILFILSFFSSILKTCNFDFLSMKVLYCKFFKS